MRLKMFRQNEAGSAIIEYALVFPVFIFLLFSIIELSLIGYADSLMDTLGTQVSRWAKTGYDYSGGKSYSFKGGANEGFTPGTKGSYYSVDGGGNVIMDGREGFLREFLRGAAGNFLKPEKLVLTTQLYDQIDGASGGSNATPYNVGEGMDAVAYTVSYKWDIYSPLLYVFFGGTSTTLSSTVIIQNEAF